MARSSSTRSAGAKLHRTETVSIRLDPRLNYLCELAARSQRRTKSSFIEAAIDEKIQSMSIANWRDSEVPSTLGERADFLWHVREHERLISLGLVAPHLMTFEEQEIWATISENGHFWRGRWTSEGDRERWVWSRDESSILRDRTSWWKHLHAPLQIVAQISGNRLFPRPSLRLGYPDHPPAKIDVFSADREDLRVPHAGVQADEDKGMDILVVVLRCR